MAATLLGSLLVSLGMESSNFKKGMTDLERSMKVTQQKFQKLGDRMQSVGKSMTLGITAPLAGVGLAAGKAANDLASEMKDMRNSAQVAGEGFEEFQRQAHAASSVGIDFEKLGDQFKDVRDRIGDFAATGGGPMADFFENIAPKVGVTADQFKKLGGKDALQLYYDSLKKAGASQEEMVFYLEAMASDTTALIPLLEQGGKAFDEIGSKATIVSDSDSAALAEYTEAQRRMGEATKSLTVAFVKSGLLDAITSIIEGFANFASKLSNASPLAFKMTAVVGGLAAAIGPAVIVAGSMTRAFGDLLPVLRKLKPAFTVVRGAMLAMMTNPAILAFAGVVVGIYLAWKNWDKITAIVQRLYQGVKTWMQDKLGAVFEWVRSKIEMVEGAFRWLWDRVVGNSWIPDMVDGIGHHMARLDSLMVDKAMQTTAKTEEAFKELSGRVRSLLDRLFPEMAEKIKFEAELSDIRGSDLPEAWKQEAERRLRRERYGDWMVKTTDTEPLTKGMADIAEAAKGLGDRAQVQTVRVAESFKDMATKTLDSLRGLADSIKKGGFLDIFENVVGLFLQIGSTGLFGQKLATNINKVPAYANGTNFHPGGMALVGERGPELVNMPRGSQVMSNSELRRMAGGKLQVEVVANNNGFGAIVRDHAGAVVAQAAPSIAGMGSAGAQMTFARSRKRAMA